MLLVLLPLACTSTCPDRLVTQIMIPFSRNSSSATERLHPGQIFYLKKRAECNEEEVLAVNVSDGCFDHLVLILSTDDHKAQAEALIVSFFLRMKTRTFDVTNPDFNLAHVFRRKDPRRKTSTQPSRSSFPSTNSSCAETP